MSVGVILVLGFFVEMLGKRKTQQNTHTLEVSGWGFQHFQCTH